LKESGNESGEESGEERARRYVYTFYRFCVRILLTLDKVGTALWRANRRLLLLVKKAGGFSKAI